ncbi:hypothetical protein ZIOFF_054205 [Zingiber officinale]|uniref:Reverse transcriptase domain-containing protein n=1 Tax=Zingiber officinale TaxID=94328 RepID=A0A8J5KDG5_ZINOF|nr:hypothetical protein ZIOFF_054205 [Zingiber officinale]
MDRLKREVEYYKAQYEALLLEKELREDFNQLNGQLNEEPSNEEAEVVNMLFKETTQRITAAAEGPRKMDNCFKGTEDFIAIYIDDILFFSLDEQSHAQHLRTLLDIVQKNGLVLSPTKMKIAVPEVEFLGAILGNQKIKLQPHIIKDF